MHACPDCCNAWNVDMDGVLQGRIERKNEDPGARRDDGVEGRDRKGGHAFMHACRGSLEESQEERPGNAVNGGAGILHAAPHKVDWMIHHEKKNELKERKGDEDKGKKGGDSRGRFRGSREVTLPLRRKCTVRRGE
mmetsp:Transcript_31107/g.61344  ORF Transcript_31107/g.61344 Transcript_31107/m.61344 type:complete len:136 (-) Transcript_31107:154-561(-)